MLQAALECPRTILFYLDYQAATLCDPSSGSPSTVNKKLDITRKLANSYVHT